jgi:hypothetical protein
MKYVLFTLGFTLLHAAVYTIAGALILKVSKDVYEGKTRLMSYLRDKSDENERGHVQKWFFPAQLLRGAAMSVVLYPILEPVGALAFGQRFALLGGLMFVYTHVACAAPSPDNVEGFVYLKPHLFDRSSFSRFQLEMVTYATLFGVAAAWLLF